MMLVFTSNWLASCLLDSEFLAWGQEVRVLGSQLGSCCVTWPGTSSSLMVSFPICEMRAGGVGRNELSHLQG